MPLRRSLGGAQSTHAAAPLPTVVHAPGVGCVKAAPKAADQWAAYVRARARAPTAASAATAAQAHPQISNGATTKKRPRETPTFVNITVSSGRLGLTLQFLETGGAEILKVSPDSSLVGEVDVGDRIVTVDGKKVDALMMARVVSTESQRKFGIARCGAKSTSCAPPAPDAAGATNIGAKRPSPATEGKAEGKVKHGQNGDPTSTAHKRQAAPPLAAIPVGPGAMCTILGVVPHFPWQDITVTVSPGRLGLTLQLLEEGVRGGVEVLKVAPESSLLGVVNVGNRIMTVDGKRIDEASFSTLIRSEATRRLFVHKGNARNSNPAATREFCRWAEQQATMQRKSPNYNYQPIFEHPAAAAALGAFVPMPMMMTMNPWQQQMMQQLQRGVQKHPEQTQAQQQKQQKPRHQKKTTVTKPLNVATQARAIMQAQKASLLAQMSLKHPRIEKQLLLAMALERTNPRSPFATPAPGTVIEPLFKWSELPPLADVLKKHMAKYYELSTEKCQSVDQQEFNNMLVARVREEAHRYGWEFSSYFDDKKIRDRVRCFYKTHIQNAKKRLATMLRDPDKKKNVRDLAAHFHLIEDKCKTLAPEESAVEETEPGSKPAEKDRTVPMEDEGSSAKEKESGSKSSTL